MIIHKKYHQHMHRILIFVQIVFFYFLLKLTTMVSRSIPIKDDLRHQKQMKPDQKINSVKLDFYNQAKKAKMKSNQKKYGLSYFHKLFHQVFTHF